MSQRWLKPGAGGTGQRHLPPKKPCANPIFESWIMEWKADAEAKDTKLKYVYARALQSLRKYPLPLEDGKECSILEHFGTHMCKMIDNRMTKENMFPTKSSSSQTVRDLVGADPSGSSNKQGTSKTSRKPKKKTAAQTDVVEIHSSDEERGTRPPVRPPQRKRQYIPAYRSGPYALLMAMIKKESGPGYRGFMTKSELQRDAQLYCDTSPSKRDTHQYTAWNSMKVLENKELVLRRSSPPQFFLTPEGRTLATKLLKAEQGDAAGRDPINKEHQDADSVSDATTVTMSDEEGSSSVPSSAVATQDDCHIRLEPGKFEIVLYVDTCETNGKSKSQEIVSELQKNGVTVYVQRLSVGDFVWICRETADMAGNRNRLTISTGNKELILPYVVERKRTDDLASSIRDGRYKEQKYRLAQTKLNVIYLIESYGRGDWGLAEGALAQAMCNTQIESGFQLQETASIKETCAYLTFMTRHLKSIYERKTIVGRRKDTFDVERKPPNSNEAYAMLFSDFNDFAVKKTHWNVKEMFARHLLRMKGLSVHKTVAILQRYPTVDHLNRAYFACTTDKQRELLLAPLFFGTGGRKIGPSISRKLYRYYSSNGADLPA